MSEVNAKTRRCEAVRFPVFVDCDGNRFVFPGLYSFESTSVSWGFCRQIEVALRVREESNTLNIVPEDDGSLSFGHVTASAESPGFLHGSGDVWLIGGPKFDSVAALSPTSNGGDTDGR